MSLDRRHGPGWGDGDKLTSAQGVPPEDSLQKAHAWLRERGRKYGATPFGLVMQPPEDRIAELEASVAEWKRLHTDARAQWGQALDLARRMQKRLAWLEKRETEAESLMGQAAGFLYSHPVGEGSDYDVLHDQICDWLVSVSPIKDTEIHSQIAAVPQSGTGGGEQR